eukprot:1708031-Pyramimonas_sp.AAC.1
MERLWTPEGNPNGKRIAAGIYESSRIILTSPICVQEAPAQLAIRELSGLIQSTILRCALRCTRAL